MDDIDWLLNNDAHYPSLLTESTRVYYNAIMAAVARGVKLRTIVLLQSPYPQPIQTVVNSALSYNPYLTKQPKSIEAILDAIDLKPVKSNVPGHDISHRRNIVSIALMSSWLLAAKGHIFLNCLLTPIESGEGSHDEGEEPIVGPSLLNSYVCACAKYITSVTSNLHAGDTLRVYAMGAYAKYVVPDIASCMRRRGVTMDVRYCENPAYTARMRGTDIPWYSPFPDERSLNHFTEMCTDMSSLVGYYNLWVEDIGQLELQGVYDRAMANSSNLLDAAASVVVSVSETVSNSLIELERYKYGNQEDSEALVKRLISNNKSIQVCMKSLVVMAAANKAAYGEGAKSDSMSESSGVASKKGVVPQYSLPTMSNAVSGGGSSSSNNTPRKLPVAKLEVKPEVTPKAKASLPVAGSTPQPDSSRPSKKPADTATVEVPASSPVQTECSVPATPASKGKRSALPVAKVSSYAQPDELAAPPTSQNIDGHNSVRMEDIGPDAPLGHNMNVLNVAPGVTSSSVPYVSDYQQQQIAVLKGKPLGSGGLSAQFVEFVPMAHLQQSAASYSSPPPMPYGQQVECCSTPQGLQTMHSSIFQTHQDVNPLPQQQSNTGGLARSGKRHSYGNRGHTVVCNPFANTMPLNDNLRSVGFTNSNNTFAPLNTNVRVNEEGSKVLWDAVRRRHPDQAPPRSQSSTAFGMSKNLPQAYCM